MTHIIDLPTEILAEILICTDFWQYSATCKKFRDAANVIIRRKIRKLNYISHDILFARENLPAIFPYARQFSTNKYVGMIKLAYAAIECRPDFLGRILIKASNELDGELIWEFWRNCIGEAAVSGCINKVKLVVTSAIDSKSLHVNGIASMLLFPRGFLNERYHKNIIEYLEEKAKELTKVQPRFND